MWLRNISQILGMLQIILFGPHFALLDSFKVESPPNCSQWEMSSFVTWSQLLFSPVACFTVYWLAWLVKEGFLCLCCVLAEVCVLPQNQSTLSIKPCVCMFGCPTGIWILDINLNRIWQLFNDHITVYSCSLVDGVYHAVYKYFICTKAAGYIM
jgi:hypothetical protein